MTGDGTVIQIYDTDDGVFPAAVFTNPSQSSPYYSLSTPIYDAYIAGYAKTY